MRECNADELTWARKRFIESYVRWGELQQDQYLLPDGELKTLLEEHAEQLALGRHRALSDNLKPAD
jgi:hypothetical protein